MIGLLALMVLAGASVNAQTITETFGSGANQFQIEFVTIGNPNNPADTTGRPNPVGSVPYIYNLGKYEISRDMVLKASAAGGLGLTLQDMTNYGGNGPSKPATGISWNEAARFVNWLNSSKGFQVAYNFSTSGPNDNITLWGVGQYHGGNQYRHKDAYFFLPSVDEWYKGAYGDSGGAWYDYPTGSNAPPSAVGGGTSAGSTVYLQATSSGPADIADAGGESPYGTIGQGGNVWEWNESAYDGSNDVAAEDRAVRGGGWGNGALQLAASHSGFFYPSLVFEDGGFRVAMVPEPSSLSLLLAGGVVLIRLKKKKVKSL